MKINCIELSIYDEELGCEVTFSDKKNYVEELLSISEILASNEKYLLMQRFYPEDEFSSNTVYFETHNENLCGDLIDYQMSLSKTSFKLKLQNEKIEVSLNLTNKEFKELKKVLSILTNNRILID